MFVKDVYLQIRRVLAHTGTIFRGGTEDKTLVIKH
jgi:hypothetical protein